ncbi:hypothetical protein F5887DRAFT_1089297 [Amanita rubescens]|nr:hypothetical protein F5887DRAFT_1089297 [Amanita rubescens]
MISQRRTAAVSSAGQAEADTLIAMIKRYASDGVQKREVLVCILLRGRYETRSMSGAPMLGCYNLHPPDPACSERRKTILVLASVCRSLRTALIPVLLGNYRSLHGTRRASKLPATEPLEAVVEDRLQINRSTAQNCMQSSAVYALPIVLEFRTLNILITLYCISTPTRKLSQTLTSLSELKHHPNNFPMVDRPLPSQTNLTPLQSHRVPPTYPSTSNPPSNTSYSQMYTPSSSQAQQHPSSPPSQTHDKPTSFDEMVNAAQEVLALPDPASPRLTPGHVSHVSVNFNFADPPPIHALRHLVITPGCTIPGPPAPTNTLSHPAKPQVGRINPCFDVADPPPPSVALSPHLTMLRCAPDPLGPPPPPDSAEPQVSCVNVGFDVADPQRPPLATQLHPTATLVILLFAASISTFSTLAIPQLLFAITWLSVSHHIIVCRFPLVFSLVYSL